MKALADRFAEAFAEAHARARAHASSGATRRTRPSRPDELIGEPYRGIRPAPGYPAQPDHTEKATLFRLLDAEPRDRRRADRELSPCGRARRSPASTSRHPESYYFGVAKVERDQVEDYAARKGMAVEEVERWLGADPQLCAGAHGEAAE